MGENQSASKAFGEESAKVHGKVAQHFCRFWEQEV
jgi:hypothetical protein